MAKPRTATRPRKVLGLCGAAAAADLEVEVEEADEPVEVADAVGLVLGATEEVKVTPYKTRKDGSILRIQLFF